MVFRFRLYPITFFIILSVMVYCTGQQDNIRQKQLFDLNWKFHFGDVSRAFETGFNDNHWQNLDLPHDWGKDAKVGEEVQNRGYKPSSDIVGWYRKKFLIPSEWQNKQVGLFFEDINVRADIYINGTFLSANQKLSASYQVDLTPYLNKDVENTVAVCINHIYKRDMNGLNGFGLSKHIWLIVADPIGAKN